MKSSSIFDLVRSKFGFALTLLLGLFLTFSAFRPADHPDNAKPHYVYSGEALAQGIFFADGPVADLIPEVAMFRPAGYTDNPEQLQHFRNYQNEVFNEVRNSSPNFFADFQNAVYSDNPATVRNAILNGKNLLGQAMERINPLASYDVLNDPQVQTLKRDVENRLAASGDLEGDLAVVQDYLQTYGGSGGALMANSWIAEAVALVAVRVAVAFWVEYHYWTPDVAVTDGGNKLLQDRIVASVVTRL